MPVHLLTGGGRGVMTSVSKAFAEVPLRAGKVIGILPCRDDDPARRPKDGYPNPWVEIAIRTHLPKSGDHGEGPHSRNAINLLSSDVVIILPGGAGTASEARLAVRYGRPLMGFLGGRPEPPWWPADAPRASSVDDVERFVRQILDLS